MTIEKLSYVSAVTGAAADGTAGAFTAGTVVVIGGATDVFGTAVCARTGVAARPAMVITASKRLRNMSESPG